MNRCGRHIDSIQGVHRYVRTYYPMYFRRDDEVHPYIHTSPHIHTHILTHIPTYIHYIPLPTSLQRLISDQELASRYIYSIRFETCM